MCACVVRALCWRTLLCHGKLQTRCQCVEEFAGPCQRGRGAVGGQGDCVLRSVPVLSLAGRSVHSMKHSQVLFLGLPLILG